MNSIELAKYVNHMLERIDAWITLEMYENALSEILDAIASVKAMYSSQSISGEVYDALMNGLNQRLVTVIYD